ncbi:Appr-1-p processing protein [Deinococcus ruber]|uniref:Appr-1-p processing protein n=1 Tax=Deinococcus ruber TaxID=1848197 RepID=A0A918CHS7_9DEIO|nr:Appr-1-p processing protein [Deinococcus ruber]GGR24469.1 Appr-1-p processing protein [Deinococcus ruber]
MPLAYVLGDATQPQGDGLKLIVHVCNDIGAWGRGFVVALSRRSRVPELAYKRWAAGETGQPFELGEVQFVQIEAELWVANLIGQHDIARKSRPTELPPVRYQAIRTGLGRVHGWAREHGASVHMPRIGAGVAGGDWAEIEPILQQELSGLSVSVYDLPSADSQNM